MNISEPTKAYNLLRTSIVNAKENPSKATKQVLRTTIKAYMTAIVVNHLITAFVDTMRGDDEDEPWLEEVVNKAIEGVTGEEKEKEPHSWKHRYIWNFVDNMVNEPLQMIPFAKDFASVMQGYDIKRMDMQGVSEFVNAAKRALSDKYTIGFKIADMTTKAADVFGVPASSVRRELATATKLLLNATDNPWLEYQYEKLWNSTKSSSNRSKFLDILYKAYEAGDKETYNRIVKDLVEEGFEAKSIESGIRSRAKKAGVDVNSINEFSAGVGIKPSYEQETEEKEDYSVNNLTADQYVKYSDVRGDLVDDIISEFERNGFNSLDKETANKLLSAAYKYAEETALEKASGYAYDSDTKWVNQAQDADEIGLSPAEYIMLKEEYSATSLAAENTYKAYNDAGIPVDRYLEIKGELNDIKPDYKNGKEVKGSRRDKVENYLNSVCENYKQYLFLLGIEYPSVKDDADYIAYFGRE